MIATGTDVKPLEVLLFMRDVRSINYFEQMKGRGTRTIQKDTLQLVSKTAKSKTHFVIVDAVGATKSKKTDSRPLERKPTVPMKDLLQAVSMGIADEDLFLSLANRMIRLEKQITEKEKDRILEFSGGKNLKQITKELITAFDQDVINEKAQLEIDKTPKVDQTPDLISAAKKEVQDQLILEASKTFHGEFNDYVENVRKQHDQIIDSVNIDTVTKSEWETTSVDKATEIVKDFTQYLEANKDEIKALSIFYNQPYNRRDITFKMIQNVMKKLQFDKPLLAPDTLWDAYVTLSGAERSHKPKDQLTVLVSLIRRACGIDNELKAYDKTIDENFKTWMFQQNAGQHNRFTPEQLDWLRMIKEHVVSSYHIELDDLEYTPFDAKGGKGKMYQLFGNQMNKIIDELNEVLAA
jgi:type I restriction enzyme R subunit